MADKEMSFWDHLEDLRKVLFTCAILLFVLMMGAFFLKEPIFNVIFAPLSSDFILYRGFDKVIGIFGASVPEFDVQIINYKMTAQFFTHVKVSFYVALVVGMPFLFYELWTFVRPALYPKEKKAIKGSFGFAAILFYTGVLVGYYMVLPLTVRFLGTYQVSPDVPNAIDLSSYIGIFTSLIIIMGIVFEMPILAALLSRLGVISKEWMKQYRRHAVVVLVIVAAIITPSGDPFTLMVVSVPLYLLYELSIFVARSNKGRDLEEGEDVLEEESE
ncbi:MAG: twin-arginine translocase subunit TatC [Bacteroidales bacterium]|nr:twin-arginine translocase subunit TatC [Bacteroidales bacterium]